MATVTITGNTIRGATTSKDNRTWQIRAVAYQYGGTEGGVITPGADWETLYPVDGVLTFTAEAGSVVEIKTPDEVPYRVRIPTSNAGLWDTIEAGVAYQPDVAQDLLNRAVANAAPGFIAAELGQRTADAITTDLANRRITFTDIGGGEGYFSVGGVPISGTLVPPAATWSGVADKDAGDANAGDSVLPRRDTAANWTSENPVLADGELGYETDTGLEKRGDGVSAWNDMGYTSVIPGGVQLFVDPDFGDDSHSGLSWDRAFATIQAAFDAAGSGAEIVLAPTAHDVGTGATVSGEKVLTVRGAKSLTRRQQASIQNLGQAYIFSSEATAPNSLISVTAFGLNAYGWTFENLYFAGDTIAVGGACIDTVNLCKTLVSDCSARFLLGGTDEGDDERYMVRSDVVAPGDDAAWWHFRNCHTYGMRGVMLANGANYATFSGCAFQGRSAGAVGAYVPAGPAVYIKGSQPNLSGLDVEGWQIGVHLDTCRAPAVTGLVGEWCDVLLKMSDCYDAVVSLNSGISGSAGLNSVLDEDGVNNLVIGTPYVARTNSNTAQISRKGMTPFQAAGGYLGLVYDYTAGLDTPGGEMLPGLGMFDSAMSMGGIAAEYWDGVAWTSWAEDTNPLHILDSSGITIDATHKRCRFILGNYKGGRLPTLVFGKLIQYVGTAGTITVRSYSDAGRTTVDQEYTLDWGPATSQLRGFQCQPRGDGGYWLEVELELGLTGAQTASFQRLHAWSTDFSGAMDVARVMNGISAPEGRVTGTPGDFYFAHAATTDAGLYKKISGFRTNTGWSPFATVAGSETLENKAIVSPKVSGYLKDGNNANWIYVGAVASAVNYLQINNAATGGKVGLHATGTDVDITLNLVPKGAGTLQANGVAVATKYSGTAALNFGSVSAQSYADLTMVVTGAVTGDCVSLGVPTEAVTAGIAYTGWVSGAGTVTVRAHNYTSGALDPASGTFKAVIIR